MIGVKHPLELLLKCQANSGVFTILKGCLHINVS